LSSLKAWLRKISKIGFIMGKTCTVTINQKPYKQGQQTHTSILTIIVFTTLTQKKKSLVTQKMQRLKIMPYRPKRQ